MTRELTYRDAINEAIGQEMRRDPTVIVLGEDVAGGGGRKDQTMVDALGGPLGATKGLIKEFGPERVIDTPISEAGFVGAAVGAALTGLRPIVEFSFISFVGVCLDQLSNQASKLHYMSGGQAKVPMTIRTTSGAGISAAAQHSDSVYSVLIHYPGLKVVLPATPHDVKGLMISAIRDDNPVVVVENKILYNDKGPVMEEPYAIPLGKGEIKRSGSDLTLVGFSRMVKFALQAAELLAKDGIEAEVIDPRTAAPLDEETILSSVKKTGRLVVVDEDTPRCGLARDVAALVADQGFDYLDAAIKIVTPPNTPVPFSPVLEKFYLPDAERIAAVAKSIF
jgi:pyruvate dehydrogenase E1 component beta subunit